MFQSRIRKALLFTKCTLAPRLICDFQHLTFKKIAYLLKAVFIKTHNLLELLLSFLEVPLRNNCSD